MFEVQFFGTQIVLILLSFFPITFSTEHVVTRGSSWIPRAVCWNRKRQERPFQIAAPGLHAELTTRHDGRLPTTGLAARKHRQAHQRLYILFSNKDWAVRPHGVCGGVWEPVNLHRVGGVRENGEVQRHVGLGDRVDACVREVLLTCWFYELLAVCGGLWINTK